LFLDISRLVFGTWRGMPTGIDRVELAYVRYWLKHDPERVTFLLRGKLGNFVAIPQILVRELLVALDTRRLGALGWAESAKTAASIARTAITRLSFGRGMRDVANLLATEKEITYLLVSHMGADRPGPIATLKRKGVKFVPLVHDLIPVNYPEYASPDGVQRHFQRIEAFVELADGMIANSSTTAGEISYFLSEGRSRPDIVAAPLGVDRSSPDENFPLPAEAYFVCIGTIEPRKNHLLLLNTWRVLAERLGPDTPKLILIGRRGWENENVLDMLERCQALAGVVREYTNLPDNAVARLLQGARALLFPSFTEGYGLPLAEALALGVPAICSDLPALREVGGDVPEYLDPLDGLGWRRLILSFMEDDSPVREAQLRRMKRWQQPSWEHHFSIVDPWLRQIARASKAVTTHRLYNTSQAATTHPAPTVSTMPGS
jgi:glycosyltransferase involved in cell wall biosynthesis